MMQSGMEEMPRMGMRGRMMKFMFAIADLHRFRRSPAAL